MRARRFIGLLPFGLFASAIAAQSPIRVTPCDLVNSPKSYDGRVVEVRARVNLAFEDFSLSLPGCEDAFPWIWLMYGGDVATPTPSTVNDLKRKSDSVVTVEGKQIPLVHDAALRLFRMRLTARRSAPIGKRPCYDCYLFRVTATLRGVFFAAKKDKNSFSGYGHLGCCHLLAIEQVADIDAERTAIPSRGTIRCSSETRKLDATEAQRLKSLEGDCTHLTYAQCDELGRKQLLAAAAFWNDSFSLQEGTTSGRGVEGNTETQTWESPDKLRTFTLAIESDSPPSKDSAATGGAIRRETCAPSVHPRRRAD